MIDFQQLSRFWYSPLKHGNLAQLLTSTFSAMRHANTPGSNANFVLNIKGRCWLAACIDSF